MKKLGDGLRSFLRSVGLEWVEEYMRVKEATDAVLKSYKGLEFHDYRRGTLILKFENLHALTDLYYRRNQIAEAINTIVGRRLVRDIKFISKSQAEGK